MLRDVRPMHPAGAGDRHPAPEERRRGDAVEPGGDRAEPAEARRARELVVGQAAGDDDLRVGERAGERVAVRVGDGDARTEAGEGGAEVGLVGGARRDVDPGRWARGKLGPAEGAGQPWGRT